VPAQAAGRELHRQRLQRVIQRRRALTRYRSASRQVAWRTRWLFRWPWTRSKGAGFWFIEFARTIGERPNANAERLYFIFGRPRDHRLGAVI